MFCDGMRLLLFFLIVLLTGCGTLMPQDEIAEVEPMDPGLFLGTVVAINPDFHFVIVDASNAFAIPEGQKAAVRRDTLEIGRVEFEKERTGQFAAARILEGELQKGDRIYLKR